MSETNKLDEFLAGVFRPFDAKAWERFRDWNPDAAALLEAAVAAGVSTEEVADYGKSHGYSDAATNWTKHAAAYLHSLEEPERIIPDRRAVVRIIDTEPVVITKRFTAVRTPAE